MIDAFAYGLAIVSLAIAVIGGIEVAVGSRRIRYLRDIPPLPGPGVSVSIIVAARNEERGVAAGLHSLLQLEGVRFEVIVVNDRSEDDTGNIITSLAEADSRVRVIHIHELPAGWLGKSHALQRGADAARNDWLLFTDADVLMGRTALARALSYASEEAIQHLAVTPELRMPSHLTDLFGGTFVLLFSRYAMPWKARDPQSRRFIGIGAFNLVLREAYRRVGGHTRIPFRPDDDMALGKLLKQAGLRQDVLYGRGEVCVEWYASLREAVWGLEKNAFTGLGYSVAAVLAVCASLVVFGAWPWIALFLTDGLTRLLYAGSVLVMAALYLQSTRSSGADPRLVIALPLAFLIIGYAILRATALALLHGGIHWRGTIYPLDELRRSHL